MLSTDIGVDLGTSNVLISVRGKGIVVNQPSVVAYEVSTKKVIAIGTKAKKMIGKTPENIEVVRPLNKGVISDYTIAEIMLKAFIRSAMELEDQGYACVFQAVLPRCREELLRKQCTRPVPRLCMSWRNLWLLL